MLSLLLWKLLIMDPFDEAPLYLGGIEGIQLQENAKGEICLKGELQRMSDFKKVRAFLKQNPEVKNETNLSPESGLQIEKLLLKRAKILAPGSRINRRGAEFYLSGTDSIMVLEALRKVYPSVKFEGSVNRKNLASGVSIFLEIALVEVKKSALKKLGLRLGSPIGVSTAMGLQLFAKTGMSGNLSSDPVRAFLDFSMQSGEARMHAKQSIVSENGKKGTFMAGGEFPIKMVSGIMAKVEFKRFGMIIEFTPQIESLQRVHLEIDAEISDIDTGSMVDGVPVIIKKQIRTQLSAKLDQMMAIGGLIHTTQSKLVDSIPGLSAIPILGRLFQSEDFKRHKSEAYIFITPRRMDSPWLPSPEL